MAGFLNGLIIIGAEGCLILGALALAPSNNGKDESASWELKSGCLLKDKLARIFSSFRKAFNFFFWNLTPVLC